MESYPEQCNTPEGKHFTREISEEEAVRQIQQMGKAPPAVPSPQPSGETANWKTYQDKEILFKYPIKWEAIAVNEGIRKEVSIDNTDFKFTIKFLISPQSEAPLPSGTKYAYRYLAKNEDLESFAKSISMDSLQPLFKKTTVDNLPAVQVEYPKSSRYEGALTTYVLLPDKRIIEISGYPISNEQIINQILNTIKFQSR